MGAETVRIEHDSLGPVEVPADRYWGAQTERARRNFVIGPPASMPLELIRALALVKQAAARAHADLGLMPESQVRLIEQACEDIRSGALDAEFPLVIWQTGSGTQTHMNVNEVIANRAHVLNGGRLTDPHRLLHPNDDVNRSQSSNDVVPTAMHVAAVSAVRHCTLPGLARLRTSLAVQAEAFMPLVKAGRTHLMDATPVTLGQTFGGYVRQLDQGQHAIERALDGVLDLALGGTATGTGLNAPPGFAGCAVQHLARLTGEPYRRAPDPFEAQAAHDALVELSGAFKRLAVSLAKIAGDLRLLGSGPRTGLGELHLPDNEPGSSIMPGKVNPTQAEAVIMVAAQVMANDLAVTLGGAGGQLELNACKPLIAANVLHSARLLGDACASFAQHCVDGIEPDRRVIQDHLQRSLMLVTALNPHIGYAKAADIAKKALTDGSTLKAAALALGTVTEAEFDAWVDPTRMVGFRSSE